MDGKLLPSIKKLSHVKRKYHINLVLLLAIKSLFSYHEKIKRRVLHFVAAHSPPSLLRSLCSTQEHQRSMFHYHLTKVLPLLYLGNSALSRWLQNGGEQGIDSDLRQGAMAGCSCGIRRGIARCGGVVCVAKGVAVRFRGGTCSHEPPSSTKPDINNKNNIVVWQRRGMTQWHEANWWSVSAQWKKIENDRWGENGGGEHYTLDFVHKMHYRMHQKGIMFG